MPTRPEMPEDLPKCWVFDTCKAARQTLEEEEAGQEPAAYKVDRLRKLMAVPQLAVKIEVRVDLFVGCINHNFNVEGVDTYAATLQDDADLPAHEGLHTSRVDGSSSGASAAAVQRPREEPAGQTERAAVAVSASQEHLLVPYSESETSSSDESDRNGGRGLHDDSDDDWT